MTPALATASCPLGHGLARASRPPAPVEVTRGSPYLACGPRCTRRPAAETTLARPALGLPFPRHADPAFGPLPRSSSSSRPDAEPRGRPGPKPFPFASSPLRPSPGRGGRASRDHNTREGARAGEDDPTPDTDCRRKGPCRFHLGPGALSAAPLRLSRVATKGRSGASRVPQGRVDPNVPKDARVSLDPRGPGRKGQGQGRGPEVGRGGSGSPRVPRARNVPLGKPC